ncbi:MAG: efflux RND transporter periplasmic adaptor subunit [Patescibacteria group bacterium]
MKLPKFLLKPWVLITLVLVLVGGGYGTYRIVKAKKVTTTYKTATVTKGTLTASVSGTGNVIVTKSSNVNPSISGDVKNLSVKVGDKVTKGQTLFKITNDDLDISVSKAYASLLQANQSLTDSENQLTTAQNNQTTINNDSNSTDTQKTEAAQKVLSSTTAVEVAKINVQSAQSSYNSAKKTASERTVTASIDGTVTEVNIADGDTLGSSSSQSSSASSASTNTSSSSSSSTPIVINDMSSLNASISLNEVDASSVEVGQTVSMTFDAIDDLTLTGKVLTAGTTGTESSGVVTYPITISFDSLDDRIKSQMSVTATITTEVKQDVLMVVNSAIKTSGTESYVLLMKDGSPIKQTIVVGIANDSYTEVTSGLNENDTIVTQTITSGGTSSSNSSSSSQKSSQSSFNGLTGSSGGGTPPSGGPGGMGM